MTLMTWFNVDGADWFRYANAALASLVVLLLSLGATARWETMPSRFKRITPWVVMTYAVIAYGSAEIAVAPEPVDLGLRVILMALTLIGLVIALLYGITDDDYST